MYKSRQTVVMIPIAHHPDSQLLYCFEADSSGCFYDGVTGSAWGGDPAHTAPDNPGKGVLDLEQQVSED